MNGSDAMPDTNELSEAMRALLEKYLRGDRPQTATSAGVITQHAGAAVAGQRERVVPIQISGSKRPFFFLHGEWKSAPFYCFTLARDMGADQPFFAPDPYDIDDLRVPPPIEATTTHLQSLRAVQPQGPYLLGGFCNGGLLAYEMARQLHEQGQTVDLLVLMDPVGLVYPARLRLVHGVIRRFGDLVRLGQEKQIFCYVWLQHVYSYLLDWYWYLPLPHVHNHARISRYRRWKNSERQGTVEQSEPGRRRDNLCFALPRLDAIFPLAKALRLDHSVTYDWVAMSYVPPGPYPGKITFFWDDEEPFRRVMWSRMAKAKEVHLIAGTLTTSRTEYLQALAAQLKTCLDKAQAAARQGT
jgi:Thioesterase domain